MLSLDQTRDDAHHLLWDRARFDTSPSLVLFDPAWWRSRKRLTGEAEGRGAAYFLDGLDGRAWVLRHNRRGGLLSHLNHDRFLWRGAGHARPLAELRLLAGMHDEGLPVPAPVAALATRSGAFYCGDVVTERILGGTPLADLLMRSSLPVERWRGLGEVIADFHRAGIEHADLNARNVLVDAARAFHLIDFDKARRHRRASGDWRQLNLARLRRSLDKFSRKVGVFHFAQADWAVLQQGYAERLEARL